MEGVRYFYEQQKSYSVAAPVAIKSEGNDNKKA